MTCWSGTGRVGDQAGLRSNIVHDLALKRIHRLQCYWLTRLFDLGNSISSDRGNFLAMPFAVTKNVEHESRTLARLLLNCQTSKFLESIQGFPVLTDHALQAAVSAVVGNDRDGRAISFYSDFDVTIEVGDVEQLLEVVGCNIAFLIELFDEI